MAIKARDCCNHIKDNVNVVAMRGEYPAQSMTAQGIENALSQMRRQSQADKRRFAPELTLDSAVESVAC